MRETTEKAVAAREAARQKHEKATAELDEATSRNSMEVQFKPSGADLLAALEEEMGEYFTREAAEFFKTVRAQMARRKQEAQPPTTFDYFAKYPYFGLTMLSSHQKMVRYDTPHVMYLS